jgi:uncharacterized protein
VVYTYATGKRNFIGGFVNGEPNGKHRWWWPNGQLKVDGRYTAGLQQGDFNYYNEVGGVILTIKFKNGAEVKLGEEKLPPPFEVGGFTE